MRMASKTHGSSAFATYLKTIRGKRTLEEMAEQSGMTYSGWSKLERGQRIPSLTTLFRLHRLTGKSILELAEMSGVPLEASANRQDRADRIAAMEQAIPEMSALVSLLPRLRADQIDMLLTIASKMIEGETD